MLRGLFLFDGLVFSVVGVVVLVFASAKAAALPAEAGDTAHLRDTRRLLASAYLAAGLFLLFAASGQAGPPALRTMALLRAASLMVMVGVNVTQIRSGRWKRASLMPYVVLFPIMAAAYVWLDP